MGQNAAEDIAKKSLEITADLCIYTNDNIVLEDFMTTFTERLFERYSRSKYC